MKKITKDQKRSKKLKERARIFDLERKKDIQRLKILHSSPEHVANPLFFKIIDNNKRIIRAIKQDGFVESIHKNISRVEMNNSKETKELVEDLSTKIKT